MQQEVVEASGHLIDSHVMEQIFDTVVEYNGRFEVEQFRIGRTNAESSYLRLKLETAQAAEMQQLLGQLLGLGCTPVDTGDADAGDGGAGLLRSGGFLFHHQPSHARCGTQANGSESRTSAWTRWWCWKTAARRAAGCAICARATGWWWGCAASA